VCREPLLQRIRHPDVDSAVTPARKNVNVVHYFLSRKLNQAVVPSKAGTTA
jgi:hypothetical protein